METKKTNTSLVKIDASEFGIEESKAKQIQEQFQPMLDKMVNLEKQANEVFKLPIETASAKAKEVRLQYVKVRTGTAEIHKEQKAFYLQAGRFVSKIDTPKVIMDLGVQEGLTRAIYAAWNGVYRMSPEIPELVETSNNIARVMIKDGNVKIGCLTRSSVESSKMDLAMMLRATFELIGCEVELSGDYPGWAPDMDSSILKVLRSLYETLYNEKPHVAACHAGLECGILGTHYPDMEMISFGPNIKGAHSPDERVQISSVQKFWIFVLEILKHIPKA